MGYSDVIPLRTRILNVEERNYRYNNTEGKQKLYSTESILQILVKSCESHIFPQFSSVTQSCPTLCDPRNHSTPGFPLHHQLPEFTQTHVHCVGDAIQPSHPLLSPSPTPNLS